MALGRALTPPHFAWRRCSLSCRSPPPHGFFTFKGWELLQFSVFAQIEARRAVSALLLHNLGSPRVLNLIQLGWWGSTVTGPLI